jgi:hypothetical protein
MTASRSSASIKPIRSIRLIAADSPDVSYVHRRHSHPLKTLKIRRCGRLTDFSPTPLPASSFF